MKNLARSCLIRRGLDVLASVFYHQARNKITAPSRSPPSKKYKKGIMAGPPKTLPKRLKNMKTSGQSQVIEVSSKSAEGPTSKQTKNSYKTNYLSDSKVINPKSYHGPLNLPQRNNRTQTTSILPKQRLVNGSSNMSAYATWS